MAASSGWPSARASRHCIAWWRASIPSRRRASSGATLKRLVRALEVYFQTGRPLTAHFENTVSPLGKDVQVGAIALRMPAPWLADRLAKRVDAQFEAGLLDEIRGLLAAGVPPDARPFGGLVYRQAMELLRGMRDEAATRTTDCAGEPKIRAAAVDLVPKRA